MAKLNKKQKSDLVTHEGAVAKIINPEQSLRRSVMSCMLWENSFYEDEVEISERIIQLVHANKAEVVADMALEARTKMKLRHIPLLLMRELARHKSKFKIANRLAEVIQRADELCEFLAIYWKDGRTPLSGQVKKGLAMAFKKFNEYDLAKYNRDEIIKLRDVLFLCHAKPKDKEQAEVWKRLVDNKLQIPDTWEVSLSAGKNKKETFERLIKEGRLGALALLRNLRNMKENKVDEEIIFSALKQMKVERVLPFRFITAARYAPQWEPQLEEAMMKCLSTQQKLRGKTVLVVDVSGSMNGNLSSKSELTRMEAAAALCILAREVCENVAIYATAGNDSSMIHATRILPPRHGFALRDAFRSAADELGGGGIFLKQVMDFTYEKEGSADRVVVFTDEQDCDRKCNPASAKIWGNNHYLINVSCEKNGIGYGPWVHIDGFSEDVIDYIQTVEKINPISN